MSAPSSHSSTAPSNLLFKDAKGAPAPVFQGDNRARSLALLATFLVERNVISAMQLLNKDPSLALEFVDIPTAPGNPKKPTEFPLAALRHGCTPGYALAVANGFDVNAKLEGGTTTLLDQAVARAASSAEGLADVSMLLAMGADPSSLEAAALHAAAFSVKNDQGLGLVQMLLDAKANFTYSADCECPLAVIVRQVKWTPENGPTMTKLMARFVKAGVSLDRSTGFPKTSPLHKALGMQNVPAMLTLIRLGAKADASAFQGRDMLELLAEAKLDKHIPEFTAATMEAQLGKLAKDAPVVAKQAAGSSRGMRGSI